VTRNGATDDAGGSPQRKRRDQRRIRQSRPCDARGRRRATGIRRRITLNTKAILRPVEKEGEKSPDFRISAGDMDSGGAWKKTSREGRDYISVKLDDPSFPAPVYARLSETAGEYVLIRSR
jgi:uncharacterized protein (DUF736 family)